jgi:hypothetical protein
VVPEYKRKSDHYAVGIIFVLICWFLQGFFSGSEIDSEAGVLDRILGIGFFVFSVMSLRYYALGKGYPGAFGLLGLIWPLGLIILFVIPDKMPQPKKNPS